MDRKGGGFFESGAPAQSRLVSTLTSVPHILYATPLLYPVVRRLRAGASRQDRKYVHFGRQLARANHVARQLALHRGPRRRILDLGSGPSYFPFVCSRLGHEVVALDVDWTPLYNELSSALRVRRVVHEIQAHVPLPDLGGPFHLISAQMICFNGHKNHAGRLWDVEEWAWFVDHLRGLAAPSGCRLVLQFNRERSGMTISKSLEAWFAQQGGRCDPVRGRVDLRLGGPRQPGQP